VQETLTKHPKRRKRIIRPQLIITPLIYTFSNNFLFPFSHHPVSSSAWRGLKMVALTEELGKHSIEAYASNFRVFKKHFVDVESFRPLFFTTLLCGPFRVYRRDQ